ncbi:MAG: hypothetical protein CVU06_09750 [Bacteroidetes bacterium HGW-Bacteroidetes-22]|nr:MAG: hypothetical protein CVU06_09750 [Bacteroidetes bacterium HGW-Bacteroidetes-22]
MLAIGFQSCTWLEQEKKPAITNQFRDTLQTNADSNLYLFPRNFFLVSFDFNPIMKKMSRSDQEEFMHNTLIPGYTYIDSLRQSGIPIFGGVYAVQKGCAFIIQAENNEALHNMLKECPLNPISKITITPLISFGQHLFELKNKMESLRPKTETENPGEGTGK